MLSEQTMEKKSPGRTTSVTSKGNASEVKKDVPFKHARIFKTKDPQPTRPESSKKQTYPRWRNYSDKKTRPKTDGDFGRLQHDFGRLGPEHDQERHKGENNINGSQVAGVIAPKEKGSFKNSKKMSFNHLLNFTVTSPNGASSFLTHDAPYLPYARRSKLPKYNKEQFLLATCQFVVHDGGDYPQDIKNIDQLVEWGLIEEVRVPTSGISDGGPVCPICLYPPVAAKITRCGHVYCWPCMLHYLALTDKPYRKCPICYEHIYKEDLKSVVFVPLTSYKVGDNVTMCLMKRDRNSIFAQPISSWKASLKKPLNMIESKEACSFQKLLIANKNQIHADIIHREQKELVQLMKEEGDKPEACFIEAALNSLRERETRLLQEEFAERQVAEVLKVVPGMADLSLSPEPYDESTYAPLSAASTIHASDETSHSDMSEEGSSTTSKNFKIMLSNTSKDHYYFYQVQDGQYMFLHALNVQMILHEYGSWENCPPVISGHIVEIENHSMLESLRSRLRYLGHLPLSTHFIVAELKLEPPYVSLPTLDLFHKDISARNKIRKGKARNERRKEKMDQKKNNKDGEVHFSLNSFHHFPATFKSENSDSNESSNIPTGTVDFPSLQESPEAESSTDTTDASSSTSACQAQESTLSFAEMAKSGSARPQHWKLEESLYTAAAASAPTATLGDCIARALVDRQTASNGNEAPSTAKGKKKKPKTTLLFSTGINYHK